MLNKRKFKINSKFSTLDTFPIKIEPVDLSIIDSSCDATKQFLIDKFTNDTENYVDNIKDIVYKEKGVKKQKAKFYEEYLKYLSTVKPSTFKLPSYLSKYLNIKPNEEFLVNSFKNSKGTSIKIKMYGKFNNELFTQKFLSRKYIDYALCLHDASHSVALFLKEKHLKKAIGIHSIVPFAFPSSLPYVMYYTQKYNYPLITTEVDVPVKDVLESQWVPTLFKRWCSVYYKINPAKYFYKWYDLNGIIQLKGMTKYQSPKRNKMYKGNALDLVSSPTLRKKIMENERIKKKMENGEPLETGEHIEKIDWNDYFYAYQELPIHDMTDEEIEDLILDNGLKINPSELLFDHLSFNYREKKIEYLHSHGCMLCPFRGEAFYHMLKAKYPDLYNQCNQWRKWGSIRSLEKYGTEYFHFWNPKTGKGSKIM